MAVHVPLPTPSVAARLADRPKIWLSLNGCGAQEEAAVFKAHLFMSLRFIFSMERNRKIFKRLFPPSLFAAFIDVGHYQFSLPHYTDLVQRWDGSSDKTMQSLAAALEDINLFKVPALSSVVCIANCAGQHAAGGVLWQPTDALLFLAGRRATQRAALRDSGNAWPGSVRCCV